MKSGKSALATARDSISSIPGLHLWLDGTDATTMTISGGLISQWRDKSAVGNHLSQATGSLQPTMGTLSGKPAVFFDGTGRYLLSSPVAAMSGDNPFSAFIVWNKTHAVNTACRPFGWGGADQGGFVALFGSAAGSSLSSWSFGGTAGYQLGLQPNAEDYHIPHTTYLDGIVKRSGILRSTTECYRSGEYKVMTAAQASVSLTLNVLGWGWGYAAGIGYAQLPAAATSLNGHIGEILVFNTAVSSANRKVIENYLSKKWAVNLQNYRTGTAPANAPVSSPLDIPDCSLWLDASDSSTLFSDNAGTTLATTVVRMWSDKSTAAQNVKTTGTGPLLTANLQGGKPGLFFDAVGASLISTASRSTPVPCTILAVVKNLATTSAFGGVVCYGNAVNGGGNGGQGIFANGTTEYITDGSGVGASNSSDTSSAISALPKIITSQYTGANTTAGSKMFNNNVLEELYTGAGLETLTSVCVEVGGRTGSSQPTRLFRGNIHEVITYDRAITEPERCSVERYLSEKWGIAISPPTCGHPDAQDWINRVYENRGSVSQSTANKINDLCYSIDAAGIRSKIVRLNLFCGNNLAACLVPLYRGASLSGAQYGPRTDTNVNFVEADYVEIAGLAGNGSNKYLNLGDPKTLMPSWGSHHLGVDTTSDNNNNKYWMGCFMNGAATGVFADYGSVNIYPRGLGSFGASGAQIFTASGNSAYQNYTYFNTGANASTDSKLKLMSRLSSTNFTLYNNAIGGATLTQENGTFTTMPAAFNVFAAGYQNVTGGRPSTISNGYEPSASTFRGYTMGFGLTGAQVTAYTNIFNSFRDAMGRLDALTPVFGTPTATAGGFTAQITNYDTNYTWAATTTLGSVTVNGSGFITVTGVAAATSSTTTITASRSGYPRGFAIVRATSS